MEVSRCGERTPCVEYLEFLLSSFLVSTVCQDDIKFSSLHPGLSRFPGYVTESSSSPSEVQCPVAYFRP